jgi:hypothetical protein
MTHMKSIAILLAAIAPALASAQPTPPPNWSVTITNPVTNPANVKVTNTQPLQVNVANPTTIPNPLPVTIPSGSPIPVTAPNALPVTISGTANVAGTVTSTERSKWGFKFNLGAVNNNNTFNTADALITSTHPGVVEFIQVACDATVFAGSNWYIESDGAGCTGTTLPGGMTSTSAANCLTRFDAVFQVLDSSGDTASPAMPLLLPFSTFIYAWAEGVPTPAGMVAGNRYCQVRLVGHFTD